MNGCTCWKSLSDWYNENDPPRRRQLDGDNVWAEAFCILPEGHKGKHFFVPAEQIVMVCAEECPYTPQAKVIPQGGFPDETF